MYIRKFVKLQLLFLKQKITNIINNGKKEIIKKIPPNVISNQVKDDKIFSKVCPDIKLANSRIDKLKTRAKYEINSMTMINGAIAKGVPSGRMTKKSYFMFQQTK